MRSASETIYITYFSILLKDLIFEYSLYRYYKSSQTVKYFKV